MSVKRSWDVRREVRGAPEAPVRVSAKKESLKERRRKQRTIFFIALGVVGVLILATIIYLCWQPFVRIQSVQAEGPNAEESRGIAEAALEGTYLFILPKDSIFVFPEGAIRRQILGEYPGITAVAIKRASFTSIALTNVSRASAFMWCGATVASSTGCYQADAEGYVFATEDGREEVAVAIQMNELTEPVVAAEPIVHDVDMSVLRIYAPLEGAEGESPIRAHVVGADRLPDALRFVKAMKALNVGIVSVEIRGDEADLYTPDGTRITYILGREKASADLAASAFPTLNVQGGGLEYVDLRFKGKVYIKRHGEAVSI